jgi:8-oxo-dGTP pyrophosphatase MutT (NUDIX family)
VTGPATGAASETLPGWWYPLLDRVLTARAEDFTRLRTPSDGGRRSAVLVLLGESPAAGGHQDGRAASDRSAGAASDPAADPSARAASDPASDPSAGAAADPDGRTRSDPGGPDVLILQRAADMRHHAGQPAFPGGAAEPGDADPVATALREANEEVGLDPATVRVLATLPPLWIPVSGFVVTPVLAWWRAPHPVHPRQPAEVARVDRLSVAELVRPENRCWVRHPSGYVGAAFRVRGMLVWGFTAGILSVLLELAGWSRPWQGHAETLELPVAQDRPVP